MKSKKKLLLVTTSLMTCAIAASIASSLVFSGSFPVNAGDKIAGSISFTYDNNFVSKSSRTAVFKATSSEGTDFYMISDNDVVSRVSEYNKAVASFGGSDLSPSHGIRFYEDSHANKVFEFQNITSITFVENNAGASASSTFSIYNTSDGSGDPVYSGSIGVKETKTISTEVAGSHYLTIVPTCGSDWLEFKSITITYSCDPEASGQSLTSISASGYTTEYTVNSSYSFDGTVTAHYSDKDDADVTSSVTIKTAPDMSTPGYKPVTLSYTEDDVEVTTSFNIHVVEGTTHYITYVGMNSSYEETELVGVNVSASTLPTSAEEGDTVNVTVVMETGYIFGGAMAIEDGSDIYDTLTINGNNVSFTMSTFSFHMAIFAYPELTSIEVSNPKTSFNQGDAFSFGGTVTAHYYDGSSNDVTSSSTFSGYNMSSTGNQTVTVSYTENTINKTTTYSINVKESGGGDTYSLDGTYHTQYGTSTVLEYRLVFNPTSATAGNGQYIKYRLNNSTIEAYLDFSYTLNGSNITITLTAYQSGKGNTDFASQYRLFVSGSATVNSTGTYNSSDNTVTISTYDNNGNPYSKNFSLLA